MRGGKMHADEIDIDACLVARLVAEQLPQWAGLPVERVASGGTDNALFRLGGDLCVRLPRREVSTGQVEKDLRWLPMLAPLLPLAIPVPLALGRPAHGYPWTWGVYRWLAGETASSDGTVDPSAAALDLARFLAALRRVDPSAGPPAGPPNSSRGVPLRTREEPTRAALAALDGEIDTGAAAAAWQDALRAPEWPGPPIWIHGDLWAANMLVDRGRLTAILDFSALCVGDPASDVMVAWTFLTAAGRPVFRAELGVDEATWARGRGWALSWALIALPYYLETNPVIAREARRTIAEVLADRTDAAG